MSLIYKDAVRLQASISLLNVDSRSKDLCIVLFRGLSLDKVRPDQEMQGFRIHLGAHLFRVNFAEAGLADHILIFELLSNMELLLGVFYSLLKTFIIRLGSGFNTEGISSFFISVNFQRSESSGLSCISLHLTTSN